MFENDIEKLADASEKKVLLMNRLPLAYIALAALAGAYLGFGIVLIFSVGAPLAGTQFAPFMKLIMGVSFGVALSLVVFAGSELFTGNNMVFAVGKLKNRVGINSILKEASRVACSLRHSQTRRQSSNTAARKVT